jgi:hypothetical protein
MKLKKFMPILHVVLFAVAAYFIHELLLYLAGNSNNVDAFYHPLAVTYGFFLLSSAVIIGILVIVREKSIDNVGQVFLLLTCIKMGIAYAFLYPVLQSQSETLQLEKMNFFVVFALFLTVETILTIRILNKR